MLTSHYVLMQRLMTLLTLSRATGNEGREVQYVLVGIRVKAFVLCCRIYIPCIYLLNKIDQISVEELDIIYRIPHAVPISAHHKWNFDDLLEKMWQYLSLVRM